LFFADDAVDPLVEICIGLRCHATAGSGDPLGTVLLAELDELAAAT
jgi:hypothetical protein